MRNFILKILPWLLWIALLIFTVIVIFGIPFLLEKFNEEIIKRCPIVLCILTGVVFIIYYFGCFFINDLFERLKNNLDTKRFLYKQVK